MLGAQCKGEYYINQVPNKSDDERSPPSKGDRIGLEFQDIVPKQYPDKCRKIEISENEIQQMNSML
jgi:hypothetical protein